MQKWQCLNYEQLVMCEKGEVMSGSFQIYWDGMAIDCLLPIINQVCILASNLRAVVFKWQQYFPQVKQATADKEK